MPCGIVEATVLTVVLIVIAIVVIYVAVTVLWDTNRFVTVTYKIDTKGKAAAPVCIFG